MNLGLAGMRAFVTGGSRGLGRAVAKYLAEDGCEVVIASRTIETLQRTATELEQETGARVHPVVVDMMDPQSIVDGVDRAAEILGGLDIVVNAAARTGGHGEDADVYATADEQGMVLDFTEKVVGSLRIARAAEPHLRAAGGGRIVLFSGGAGRVRGGLVSAGARNRAVDNLVKTLANALGKYGIGCVAVAPNMAVTERQFDAHRTAADQLGVPFDDYLADRALKTTLMQRLVMADDLAKVASFLCSPVSWPINATTIELSGGSSPDIHYELEPHPPWLPGTAK